MIILFPVIHFISLLQIILSSQLLAVLITIIQCDARSTRVTAQYTVADDTDNAQRTFRGKGIVEDASIDDGILTKYNSRPSRVSEHFIWGEFSILGYLGCSTPFRVCKLSR